MTERPGPEAPRLRDDLFVAIGLSSSLAQGIAGGRRLEMLTLQDVTQDRMANLQGSIMACELFTAQGDALGVVAALGAAKATGHLMILAPPLPDPGMVERELRAQANGFSVTLVQL